MLSGVLLEERLPGKYPNTEFTPAGFRAVSWRDLNFEQLRLSDAVSREDEWQDVYVETPIVIEYLHLQQSPKPL